ncbi:MAG TPA: RNase adapter RapZ [Rhodocyclaceae bacterium]|nr:RNase adapter RapZ [Rhodocyclaceae bacterium]
MQLTLISGLSGSGKSIALNVLEDAGYYCVDNLPATLLPQLVSYLSAAGYQRVGVAVDVRSGASIGAAPKVMEALRNMVEDVRFLFLDSRDDTLIARFSETRRRHPLAGVNITIGEAIARERELLSPLGEEGHRIDTSNLAPNTLRAWIKDMIHAAPNRGLTLLFQSFGFKHGIPVDADMVFDVRCLPNPYYDTELRPLSGKDVPVVDFLERIPEVHKMAEDIRRFVTEWLPAFIRDGRSYFTVAIGCTGGQHRSVYLAERLAREMADITPVLVRHRSMKTGE